MSTVDVAELGLDLIKKTKKTTKKKEEAVSDAELEQIEQQAAEVFNQTYQNYRKSQRTISNDDHLDTLSEEEKKEIEDLIKSLRAGGQDVSREISSEFEEESLESGQVTWLDSDRDYRYQELLDRVTDMLQRKNPDLSGARGKIKMKIPQVVKDGPKKTIFINFAEICSNLHREKEHVLQYLCAELGTSGTTDSNSRLTIRDAFKGKDIETVLKKYISEYVVCKVCNALDTILTRDTNTRLYSLNCMSCGASRTVSAIKQGYMANTVKRRNRKVA